LILSLIIAKIAQNKKQFFASITITSSICGVMLEAGEIDSLRVSHNIAGG
jgi:tmRNA-binding protein